MHVAGARNYYGQARLVAFENPIVAGEELIRSGVRSENYTQGSAGWRVARDGSAEFEDMAVRDNFATRRLDISESISLQGNSLAALIDSLPKGLVAFGIKVQGTENWGGGEHGPVAVASFTAKAGRHYIVKVAGLEFANNVLGRTSYSFFRFSTDGNTPTNNSPLISGSRFTIPYGKPSWAGDINSEGHVWTGNRDTVFKVGLFIGVGEGDGSAFVQTWAGDPAWTMYVEDVGLHTETGIAFNTPTYVAPVVTRYDTTWWQTNVQSYQENGTQSIANNSNFYAYQGNGNAVGNPGGNHKGCFFFNTDNMRAQLAGATIISVFIYLDNVHTYSTGGVTAVIGTHNMNPVPPTVPGTAENRWNLGIETRGGDAWTGDLGPGLGNEFRDGATRGLTLGGGVANSINFYSYFNRAAIRIIYDK
jgi:hypothetical protein